MGIYSHVVHNFANNMGMYSLVIHNIGNNKGKYSHVIHNCGNSMWRLSQYFPNVKPIYGILGENSFQELSQIRNSMSHFLPNNGENSHLIPKWESKKVFCKCCDLHDLTYIFFDYSDYSKTSDFIVRVYCFMFEEISFNRDIIVLTNIQ